MSKPFAGTVLFSVTAFLVLGACADNQSLTEPQAAGSLARANMVASSPLHDAAPGDISLGDDATGRSYTLQPGLSQIQVSSGEVIELPQEMIGAHLDNFVANNADNATVVENNLYAAGYNQATRVMTPSGLQPSRISRSVSASSFAVGTTHHPTGLPPQVPVIRSRHARGVDPFSVSPAALRLGRRVVVDAGAVWTLRHVRGQRLATRAVRPRAPFARSDSHSARVVDNFTADGLSLNGEDDEDSDQVVLTSHVSHDINNDPASCLDIANTIFSETAAWRTARDEWKNQLNKLLELVQIDPTTGKVTVKRPDVENSIDYTTALNDFLDKNIQLNYMAIQYSRNGCHNNLWPDAGSSTYASTSGSQYGGSDGFACHTETWEISADGGQTWSPIDVSVCDAI